MKTLFPILIFFLCNIIGFNIGPSLYALALTKFIDIEASGFTEAIMQHHFVIIQMIWLACALFSFASFFLSKKWKIVFLLAPIIMPFLCSIALLSAYI